jgi:hypothetical protein
MKMGALEKNMGKIDSGIRLTIAAVLFVLFLTKTVSGTIGYIDLGLAVLFTVTSFVGFCPLYKLVGIKSCPNSKA